MSDELLFEPGYRGTFFEMADLNIPQETAEFFHDVYIPIQTDISKVEDDADDVPMPTRATIEFGVILPTQKHAALYPDYDGALDEDSLMRRVGFHPPNDTAKYRLGVKSFVENLIAYVLQPLTDSGFYVGSKTTTDDARNASPKKLMTFRTNVRKLCHQPTSDLRLSLMFKFVSKRLAFEFVNTTMLEGLFESLLGGMLDASGQRYFETTMFDLSQGVDLSETFVKPKKDRFSELRRTSTHYQRHHILQLRIRRSFFAPFVKYIATDRKLPDDKNLFLTDQMIQISSSYCFLKAKEYAMTQMNYWSEEYRRLQNMHEPAKVMMTHRQIFDEFCNNDGVILGGLTLTKALEFAINHQIRGQRLLKHGYRFSWDKGIFRRNRFGEDEQQMTGALKDIESIVNTQTNSGITFGLFDTIATLIRTQLAAAETAIRYHFAASQRCTDSDAASCRAHCGKEFEQHNSIAANDPTTSKWPQKTKKDFMVWCSSKSNKGV